MKNGDQVISKTELVFDANLTIPAGAKGVLRFIEEQPERVAESQWFGYNVCFPDYMSVNQTYPCLKSEIEGA